MGKKELRLGLLQYEVAKPDTPGEASPAPTNHALTLCTWRSRLATWLYVVRADGARVLTSRGGLLVRGVSWVGRRRW
jgi:hypothetical protein